MKTLLCLLAFTQILQATEPHALTGNWFSQNENDTGHFMYLDVQVKVDSLEIQQCSQKFTVGQLTCLKFSYQIINEQIFLGSRKVGDLYPYSLIVYDSNTQVTEMLKLQLRTRNLLRFTYSYTNMDGDAVFQTSELSAVKSSDTGKKFRFNLNNLRSL